MTFELKNKRLFTFGCSFTQYIWPTWADILGRQFEYFENWGLAGAGNLYIFNSIIEANQRHTFTSDDTIVIMWSGLTRVDYYHTNSWAPQGPEYEFNNIDPTGYEIINYAYIHAIKELFDRSGLNYKMISLTPLPKDSKIYKLYKSSIDSVRPFPYKSKSKSINMDTDSIKETHFYQLIENNYNRNKGSSWPEFEDYFNNPDCVADQDIRNEIDDCLKNFTKGYHHLKEGFTVVDSHPTPTEHFDALVKLFSDFTPSGETKAWVKEHTELLKEKNLIPYNTNFPQERL